MPTGISCPPEGDGRLGVANQCITADSELVGLSQPSATRSDRLLTLTMIVKDEARTIARTLLSARPHIDRWCILDTGSTDGTQAIVRDTMREMPGELREELFIDFATTRNRGLEACGTETDFILWLDADDVLEGGEALRTFLEGECPHRTPDREAYYVCVEFAGTRFESARVLDSRAGWRFRGGVHEALIHPERPPPAHHIPGVVVRHMPDALADARSRARWERDLVLLKREIMADAAASRAAFYLGMTYLWLVRYEEAIRALDRRIAMGGWEEEVFYAKLSKARAADGAHRAWPQVLALYLDAHAAAPHRAEPLYEIARRYDTEGNHALALLFARRAYELPTPTEDTLFIEEETYTWRAADLVGANAYWVGEFTLGEEAARNALNTRPDDQRLRKNLGFYEARKRRA